MSVKHLFLFLLLSSSLARTDEPTGSIDKKVLELIGHCYDSNLSIVGSDREAIISRLTKIGSEQNDHSGPFPSKSDQAKIVLLRLGDIQTIQLLVSQYQKLDSTYSIIQIPALLDWSCQPLTISYLAPDFFLKEDPTKGFKLKGTQDRRPLDVPPRSVYSCFITLEIIERSSEFSEETKAWGKAAQRLGTKDFEKFRWLMQAWWTENQEAFQKRNYPTVHPCDDESLNFLPSKRPTFVLPMVRKLSFKDSSKAAALTDLNKVLGGYDSASSESPGGSEHLECQYILDDGTKVVAVFLGERILKITILSPGQKEELLYSPTGTSSDTK